ncbi:hypothetical protein [Bradyrhizobium sp. USDA 4502]
MDKIVDRSAAASDNVVEFPRAVGVAKGELHVVIGGAVLARMHASGEALINTEKCTWLYSGGIWEMRTDIKAWLGVRIEEACEGMGVTNTNALTSEACNRILRRPELWRDDDIPWDQHGKVPTRSGLVDPRTGELEPARPDHYCTWRVEVDFDADAKCPWWEIMIADVFGDRKAGEQAALVRVVQECMGAALIDRKSRALSKGLVFWGVENIGKSGPLEVVGGLFGGDPISAPIATVETAHGLMPFVKRRPWVLHEAFDNKWHLSSTVKSIITHDPVNINIKNGPVVSQVVRSPIFWATNFQPQFKEATRAIVSRMIVIEVSRRFDEMNPIGAAAEAIRQGYSKPGELIIATELPGVLNWAIAGLKRALDRGSIEQTKSIRETADAIHRDSNLVAGFLEECVEFDPMARVRVSDFCLAHSAWFMELKGEDRRMPTNDGIGKALKAIGDGRIGMDKEMRDNRNRYYCGVALNKLGLEYRKAALERRLFEGKTAMATAAECEVNSLIPASWDDKESVKAMRACHERVTATTRVTDRGDE